MTRIKIFKSTSYVCCLLIIFSSNAGAENFQSKLEQHASFCMSADTERMFFSRLFGSNTTKECRQYALDKTIVDLDTSFFEDQQRDEDYRQFLSSISTSQYDQADRQPTEELIKLPRVVYGAEPQNSQSSIETLNGYNSVGPENASDAR
jgi:hypothetical protein